MEKHGKQKVENKGKSCHQGGKISQIQMNIISAKINERQRFMVPVKIDSIGAFIPSSTFQEQELRRNLKQHLTTMANVESSLM